MHSACLKQARIDFLFLRKDRKVENLFFLEARDFSRVRLHICNGDEYWFVATRKNAWEYLDMHEGMTAFIADTKYNGELLDILICKEFHKYNLDKEYENDKVLLEFFEKEEKQEIRSRKKIR